MWYSGNDALAPSIFEDMVTLCEKTELKKAFDSDPARVEEFEMSDWESFRARLVHGSAFL